MYSVSHLTDVSGHVQCDFYLTDEADKDDMTHLTDAADVVRGRVAVHVVIGWDVTSLPAHKSRLHPALDHFIAVHASRR